MSRIARSSDGDEKSIVGKNVGVEDSVSASVMCALNMPATCDASQSLSVRFW